MSTDQRHDRGALTHLARLIYALHRRFFDLVEKLVWPLAALGIRITIGWIFLLSGSARITNWASQEFMFTDIHPVPFLSAGIAAPLTVISELTLAVLFIIGLFGRVSATGLLIMTMMIEFVVARTPQGLENGIAHPSHMLWMLLFLAIACVGPGALSADHLLRKRLGL